MESANGLYSLGTMLSLKSPAFGPMLLVFLLRVSRYSLCLFWIRLVPSVE